MKKKKGFVLSWFFPPGNSSEGLITYKLLSHSKYDYDVWTRTKHARDLWDRKVEEKNLTSDNIHTLSGPYLQEKVWVKDAIKYFLAHKDEYAFLMTRSMPSEAHEVGYYVKKKYPDVKWIASYGDPLSNTPYYRYYKKIDNPNKIQDFVDKKKPTLNEVKEYAFSPIRRTRSKLWKKIRKHHNKDLDRLAHINDITLRNADMVILNNSYQYEHIFQGPYKDLRSKGVIIHHSYDPDLITTSAKAQNKKITFVYVGHLDTDRSAYTLLQALKKLKQYDKKISQRIVVKLYGTLCDGDKRYITESDLGDIVKVYKSIDYAKSLQEAKDADWALLFDANFEKPAEKNVYFAAKIVDYFGVKANIFAITNPDGASADAIREANCGIISTHAIDDIFMNLCKIIYKKEKPPKYNEAVRQKYTSQNVGAELDKAIQKLIKKYQ